MAENQQTTAQRIAQGSKVLPKKNASDPWHPLRIVLDEDTIQNAVRRNSHNCMIADAIAEVLKISRRDVRVDMAKIVIRDRERNLRRTHYTPIEAQRRLVWFDAGEHIDPWYFHLGKPAQIQRLSSAKLEPEAETRRRERARELGRQNAIKRGAREDGVRKPGAAAMNAARHPERPLPAAGVDAVVHGAVDDNDTRLASEPVRVGGPDLPMPGQLKATRRYGAHEFVP